MKRWTALAGIATSMIAMAASTVSPLRSEPATQAELRESVGFLSSSGLGGRLTGSEGAGLAAQYLADALEEMGARPLPGSQGLLVPFEFTAGVSDSGSTLRLHEAAGIEATVWQSGDHLQALSFSDSGEVRGAVVFAGYGLQIPEKESVSYDSYFGLDVKDKIVLVLRYFPEDAEQETRSILSRYAGLRYKALYAREHGAKALLVVTGPSSPNAGKLVPMTFDTAIAGSGLAAASISGEVGRRLFELAGKSLEEAQASLDDANPHSMGFALEGIELTLQTSIERQQRTGHNVVAYLPPTTSDAALEKPWLVLGAHYDHLGEGRHGNSLARKAEAFDLHPGADDNASGVVAILEVARALSERDRGRGVVIGLWSGEELGLLGSSAFLAQGLVAAEDIAAYINMDMVGRMRDNRLVLQAVGSSTAWPRLIEQTNVPVGFDIQIMEDPYLPTDSANFNRVRVPSLNFFTGSHDDYHRPSDLAEKVNYEDLERIIRFATILASKVGSIEAPPEFVEVETKVASSAGRDGVRAFTGTIPDYTSEGEGLLLSGVVGGGPADEAGLQGGDVIVRFGSQDITNIYDYTYALDAVKVDEPLEIVYIRDGERRTTMMTPRGRP